MIQFLRTTDVSLFAVCIAAIIPIVAMVVTIWLLVRKNGALNLQLAILTERAWLPVPCSQKLALPQLFQTMNEFKLACGSQQGLTVSESHILACLFGVHRTLVKLGITELFTVDIMRRVREIESFLPTLEREQKESLRQLQECANADVAAEQGLHQHYDKVYEEIKNRREGSASLRTLSGLWSLVKSGDLRSAMKV